MSWQIIVVEFACRFVIAQLSPALSGVSIASELAARLLHTAQNHVPASPKPPAALARIDSEFAHELRPSRKQYSYCKKE